MNRKIWKNKTWTVVIVLAAIITMATVIDCGGGGGGTPTVGFKARGEDWFVGFSGLEFLSGASIQGDWVSNNGSTHGNTLHFAAFTSSGANYDVSDGRVPARWRITVPGACIRHLDPFERDVTAGSTQLDRCVVSVSFLTADPSSVDLSSPPAAVTIAGGGFSAAYGMPTIEYYDQYSGVLVGSATAFSIAGDGSSVQFYTPDLTGVYTGSYNVVVSNVAADGTSAVVGVAPFSACCIDPPPYEPPPDPPPCGEGMICMIQ
jgi:hypothetical protein